MMKLVCLALCVALTMAASTKKLDTEFVRELLEGAVAKQTEERRLDEVTYTKKAIDQLRGLISDMYALEETNVKRDATCVPEDGDCTTTECCSGFVCQKSFKFGAKGTCVACLAKGSRCGSHSRYGTNCCTGGACGVYMNNLFTGCTAK